MYIAFERGREAFRREEKATLCSNLLGKKENAGVFLLFFFSKEPESIKKKNTHRRHIKKCERSRHREIIGSAFEMPIMVFVRAVEGAHSGSVTP